MRQRIVKESTNLFLRKGFQSTTMEEVTNAVNLTKGAIYGHFKSKDHPRDSAMVLEAIEEHLKVAFESVYGSEQDPSP